MANTEKPYARYYIVRKCQTMCRGDAKAGSSFRQFVITSNDWISTLGKFQVLGLEGVSGNVTVNVLIDEDFNGLDAAAREFKAQVGEAEKQGFRPATKLHADEV
jgi:hypothetical protein